MSGHNAVPRHLRRQLQSLGRCSRPVVVSCGLKEWSDREIGRLRPAWMDEFLRRHVWRCAFVVLLYLLAFTFLAASFERYWHWVTTVEAVAGEPVKSINKWTAYCAVHPTLRACSAGSAASEAGREAAGNSTWADATSECGDEPCERTVGHPGS